MTWSRRVSKALLIRAAPGEMRYRRVRPGCPRGACRGACADRRRRCGWCSRRSGHRRYQAARSAAVNPPGAMASARAAAARPASWACSGPGRRSGWRRPRRAAEARREATGMKPVSTQSSMVQNRPAMPASRAMMSGILQGPAGLEGLGVAHDRLEPQHTLAFGIALTSAARSGP